MEDYVVLSIETHLFFARIMKEHALFLEVGFPCRETEWIQKAEWFRKQFENLLRQTLQVNNGMAGKEILQSGELATEFTFPAEKRTQCLTGIEIDSSLTEEARKLCTESNRRINREIIRRVHQINRKSISLLDGLIDFKENILCEVQKGNLFTTNYPLLIQHILREAKLYRVLIQELMQNRQASSINLWEKEEFWNQIMMEHALFIRGLLDPTEEQLICTADEFADTYKELLERAKRQDCKAEEEMAEASKSEESLEETLRYREFKTAGTEGILECKISSTILPLLADHVLREANHYIRILKTGCVG